MATSPTLKLTYFDRPSRAETTRVVLRLGGIAFQDERISFLHFAAIKSTFSYGHVPVLHVDGEPLAETQAIVRYAARIACFYPMDDPVAALMVEEILIATNELSETKMVPIIREQDAEKKQRQLKAFLQIHLPAAFTQLDARLQRMTEYPFFQQAKQVDLHEISLSMLVGFIQAQYNKFLPPHFLDAYPTILTVHQRVGDAIASPPTPPRQRLLPQSKAPRPFKLTLTYLDLTARAEFLRLTLHIGGVPFEDERLTLQEVTDRKALLPYGQVPVIDIDGRVVAQTFALLRYAGTLSGLYPIQTDLLQAAKMDEIIARIEEIYYTFQASYEEKQPARRRVMREQLLETGVLQNVLASLETRVGHWKQSTAPFIFGEKVTLADLAVFHIVDFIQSGEWDYVPTTVADAYTTLHGVHDAVLAHPRVQDWYASRDP